MFDFNDFFNNSFGNRFNNYGYRTQRYNDNRNIILRKLYNDNMNYMCFDCHIQGEMPNFIDIKNGIFLCLKCAQKHSTLPKEISQIISNNLSEMSEENLMILYYSGNKRLYEFMTNQFPGLQKMNFEQKYKSKAMEYYRQLIKSEAFDLRKPIKPNKEEGYMSIYQNENIKRNVEKKKENNKRNCDNDDIFSKLNKTFGGIFGDDNFFDNKYSQTERNSFNKNDKMNNENENKEKEKKEKKEKDKYNKIDSDNTDEDTTDELDDKNNNKKEEKKGSKSPNKKEEKKESKSQNKKEEKKKEINEEKVEKPKYNFEIKPTTNKININQMGYIEMYPDALEIVMS